MIRSRFNDKTTGMNLLLQLMVATFLLGVMSLGDVALAAEESISGTINVIWGDPPPGSGLPPMQRFILTDDQGKSISLAINENLIKSLGGIRAINRKRVTIKGQWAAKPQTPAEESGETVVFDVQSIKIEQPGEEGRPAPAEGAALTGSQPWVTILCKFSDVGIEPYSNSWFVTEMGSTNPGMNHYWQEQSYSNINLNGSTVVGWYTLPSTQSTYVNSSSMLSLLATDCATAADADVNFPSFTGINFMFNSTIGSSAWGGTRTLTFDGQTKTYSTTWMPPWGYEAHGVLAQEMGHGFGLPHSSGPYSTPYDSAWDPMSKGSGKSGCTPDANYGCIGVHTVTYHKDILGWILSQQKFVAASGTTTSITLERLGQPTTSTAYLMAQIPISGSSTQFYTVEARLMAGGYDTNIPGNAVIIHLVDTTLSDRNAQVVDATNNSDPNDAGAMWTAGETFTDSANGISVTVNSATSTGFNVTITNGSTGTATPDIKANGLDGPITILTTDTLVITISLNAGGNNDDSDWWVAANTSFAGWYYYNLISGWLNAVSLGNVVVTAQGALSDLSSTIVLNTSGLPAGTYVFYFAVDTTMNGVITGSTLTFDSVTVTIL